MTSAGLSAQPAHRLGRSSALGAAALLLAGAVLVGVGAVVGVVHTFDRSATGVASGAVWIVLLPALLALLLSGWRPAVGLAVGAGAGVIGVGRLLADLSLLTAPNSAVRPELFYELTDRAQPFTVAPGAVLLVLGDVVMVLAGGFAARRLTAGLALRSERIFGSPPVGPPLGSGPELLAEALESADTELVDDDPDRTGPQSQDPADRPERSNWLLLAGFVGVLAILTASLGLPYQGGYLATRYLPPELDLLGIAAALLVALVAAVGVLACAVLPRQLAVAVLGGVAAGAAVPFLTAVAVRATNAPVRINPVIGLGLAGAVVLAGAGMLARTRMVPQVDTEPSARSVRLLNGSGAVLTLLVAAAALAAWRLPQLAYNGGAVPGPVTPGQISAPQAAPFLLAALIPFVGGIMWLLPGVRPAGRAVSGLAWAPLIFATAQSVYILGQLVNSASVPNAGFAAPTWSAGPGLWCAVAGIAVAAAVLVVSAVARGQAADASVLVADEDPLARARSVGAMTATGLTVVAVVALSLPIYRTSEWTSATVLVGYQVNSWGVLALAGGAITAAWAAARATSALTAAAFALAGAAVLAVRLLVPAAVRAQDGYATQPGQYVGYLAVALFVAAAAVLAISARTITMTDAVADPVLSGRGRPAAGSGSSAARGARKVATGSGARKAAPARGQRQPSGKGRK